MANSDNVIQAGMTNKFKDPFTLNFLNEKEINQKLKKI